MLFRSARVSGLRDLSCARQMLQFLEVVVYLVCMLGLRKKALLCVRVSRLLNCARGFVSPHDAQVFVF